MFKWLRRRKLMREFNKTLDKLDGTDREKWNADQRKLHNLWGEMLRLRGIPVDGYIMTDDDEVAVPYG